MLVTEGGRFGGYTFFVQYGRLHFVYNYLNKAHYAIDSTVPLPQGKVNMRYDFDYDGGGTGKGGLGTLYVNGKKVGEGRIEKTVRLVFSLDETFDIGEDTGTPASESYRVPFRFTGNLNRVQVELK